MIVKWKTSRWRDANIERVECARETEKAVWVLEYPWTLDGNHNKPPTERRRMKESDSDQFHDTWEAAHAFLLERAERHLKSCLDELRMAQGTHGKVNGMRKPTEPHEAPLQEAQG
jgi:hypothetical protein